MTNTTYDHRNGTTPKGFVRPSFTVLGSRPDDEITSAPELVLFNAIHNSEHVFCIQTESDVDGKLISTQISFAGLATAVEDCARHLMSSIPGLKAAVDDGVIRKSTPVGLLMESGANLFIHLLALLTLNVPCVLLSIRLSPEAVRNILAKSVSTDLIVSPRTADLGSVACNDTAGTLISKHTARPFNDFLRPEASYKTFELLKACRLLVREDDSRVLILHSSGTTGLPKPIPVSHRYLLGYAGCHQFPVESDESLTGLNLSTLPLFHGFGLLAPCLSLSVGKPVCFPPPSTVPNGQLVLDIIDRFAITCLMTVPSILEDITVSDGFASEVKGLQPLDFVAVGGGGIKQSVGEALHSNGVRLLNHFGATELGPLAPIFRPDPDYDWKYLRLREDMGLLTIPTKDETSEGSIVKLVGCPFGSQEPFELQDRVLMNPTSKHREIRLLGRTDDLIVLATGEKVLPHIMERAVETHPLVKRALVFGSGRFEIGLLLEPHEDTLLPEDVFIDEVWPAVDAANRVVDQHGIIPSRASIIVTPPGKRMPLSDKGVPQRKEANAMFLSEIDLVYERLESGADYDPTLVLMDENREALEAVLTRMIQQCMPRHVSDAGWSVSDDIINLGMDSLRITRLRRLISQSLQHSESERLRGLKLPRDFVYRHASIRQMSDALLNGRAEAISETSASASMLELLHRFACNKSGVSGPVPCTILVTGSNGSLGTHLLKVLCSLPHVKSIVCLMRRNTGQANGDPQTTGVKNQLLDALRQKGVSIPRNELSKVQCEEYEVGAPRLGMKESMWIDIASKVTHIIHGAWPMDFKRNLSTFEVQVSLLRELIELGRVSHNLRPRIKPRILFTSSIGAVGRDEACRSGALIRETILNDPEVALPMGYGQAKWVCEKLMEDAAESFPGDIEPMVVRIGQMAGSLQSGYWNPREHIPVLIRASRRMGKIPDLKGSLSWLPLDIAAASIAEILMNGNSKELVYHLENPVRQSWEDVSVIISRRLGLPHGQSVQLKDWIKQAVKVDPSVEDLSDFLEQDFVTMSSGKLQLDTLQSRKRSRSLRSMGGLSAQTIEKYVDAIVKGH